MLMLMLMLMFMPTKIIKDATKKIHIVIIILKKLVIQKIIIHIVNCEFSIIIVPFSQ